MAAKDKNIQPRVVSPIEVSPRLVEPKAIKYPFGGTSPTPPEPTIDPTWLYFTMPDGGTVKLTKNGSPTAVTLEYSLDNGSTWTTWAEENNVRSLSINAGQTMHVRNTSETNTGFSIAANWCYGFYFSNNTYAGGNINSLLCKNPKNAQLSPHCFVRLFDNSGGLVTPPNLPSKTLSEYCYERMFWGCTKLIKAPSLPAKVLSDGCYGQMFNGCTALTKAPSLPAKSLAKSCYSSMFGYCSSLKKAPLLPSTTLVDSCYNYMFINCTSLTYIKALFTTTPSSSYTNNWLKNVFPTGDFYCPAGLTIPTGDSGIPSGWTRHDID